MESSNDNILAIVSVVAFIVGYFVISRVIDWFRKTADLSNKPTIVPDADITVLPPETSPSGLPASDSHRRDIDDKFRREKEKRDAKWERYRRSDR